MDYKLDVDAIHILDDGTVGATHTINKTVMLIKMAKTRAPSGKIDEKGHPIMEEVLVHQFDEPDNDERLYWLHRFGVIGDEEFSVEMSKQPKQKRLAIIAKLQQEVDNVPG